MCQFIFTTAFDHFTKDDFRRYIYNQEHLLVDPDYPEARPRTNAAFLSSLFSAVAQEFCLDFHPIPSRGEPDAFENHYLPTRGKAAPSIQSFFASEPQCRVLCYSNANLTRADHAGELMRFVEFWHDLIDHDPQWLDFDSKVIPLAEMAKVNQRKIWFVTIRRRGGRPSSAA